VEDVVQTVKVLQQIKGFEDEDLPVPDYDAEKDLIQMSQQQEQQHYASQMEAYSYHEANFNSRYGNNHTNDVYQNGPNGLASMVSNYNQSQHYNMSQNPYPRQQRLLKSQIMNQGGESNNTLERNLDVASLGSKMYDADGGASVYIPVGGASSIQTYNSNYFHSKYKHNKKSSYNKSLDVVFRRRWHALSQGKGHQIKQKPRVKVNDIFIHQVSNNIQQVQRQSKQSFRSNTNEHTINIDDV
jgi:hypothetical protein